MNKGDRQARTFYPFYSLKGCGYHLPKQHHETPSKKRETAQQYR